VWARDATSLADQIMLPTNSKLLLPQAAWSLTHGPSVLEELLDSQTAAIDRDRSKIGVFGWFRKSSTAKETDSPSRRPLFPLPTSDSQNRIADLLLNQNYPAVVLEGPPGTG
jgi:hypothetical protein